jgi:hypothetical protein
MNRCPECKKRKSYSEFYDAFYCNYCDIWLERLCSDRKCKICAMLPDKPSEVRNDDTN